MAGALGVVITTDVPLGGQHAQPVYVDDSLPIVGPARAIVVTNGEIPQEGGAPLAVRLAPAGTPTTGPVMPVYVVSGDLGSNAAPVSTLLTGLISYWKLDEASGTGIDSVGTNTLTDNNTVTSAAGKVGTARQFTAANSESLSIADNASLSTGDIDFIFSVGVYLDSLAAFRYVALKGVNVAALTNLEWRIYLDSGNKLNFTVTNGTIQGVIQSSVTLAATTWYLCQAWHDSVANTVNIAINNGTVNTAAYSGGGWDSGHPFALGYNGTAQYWDGRMDDVKFAKRVWTPAERAEDYANFLSGIPLL